MSKTLDIIQWLLVVLVLILLLFIGWKYALVLFVVNIGVGILRNYWKGEV